MENKRGGDTNILKRGWASWGTPLQTMSICYYEWIRLDEWDWLMKNKNSVEQNIAFIFSVNVNTALNLNSNENN